jgi:hypothetical protein
MKPVIKSNPTRKIIRRPNKKLYASLLPELSDCPD